MPPLPISAFVVLGLLDEQGDATPYQLRRMIEKGLGNFWGFPRSQLYWEASRLVRRGLIVERREQGGRRRRILAITEQGKDELRLWLATPTQALSEIRDEGLLRLYFQPSGSEVTEQQGETEELATVSRLAREQHAAHAARLEGYVAATSAMRPGTPQRAVLELGLRFERMVIQFWREIEQSPADLRRSAQGWDPEQRGDHGDGRDRT
ncbi:PadR family transcriptional regulator [Streptomyces sp. NPDC047981]|uniref:PadR family transcriptional regulator n=1 Tax=Streptomyces sp. NPDC047981 TaxID=3154610 RepID=UPI00342733CF